MSAYQLTESIFSVGALNPSLRIFDVVMRTEFGTTYNSYILRGEKTALIETCHASYFDRYVENILEVTRLEDIDYIVLNHCEPDHSGALKRLLDLCPNAIVCVSQAGSIYLKQIANRADLPILVAKDGQEIDLGGKTLKWIAAPFLHWPDSMFSWCPEEKALFTCDFFGAHYCEPYVLDVNMERPDFYDRALKEYFDAIFGPFLPYVRAGLAKIAPLDPVMALTSHGPVLTKAGKLDFVKEQYVKWSESQERANPLVPVFYCSAYGNTGVIACAIGEGIRSVLPNADVPVIDINDHDSAETGAMLNQSKAFCIGSPTINADAVPPIWILLSHVDAINNKKKPVFVFGSYGWSGEAVPNLTARCAGLKMAPFGEGLRIQFVPTEEDLKSARDAGAAFAAALG